MADDLNIDEADLRSKGAVPVPKAILAHLDKCALLFDIDGTLIDLAETPDAVVVPPDLLDNLQMLHERTGGALALVSGRAIDNIDLIMNPVKLPAVGGHGAEMRLSVQNAGERDMRVPLMDDHLKRRFKAIAELDPGILLEDKGYSLALHYRLAPHMERKIHDFVAKLRADLLAAPIEILGGKFVVEIKAEGISKATAVRELMTKPPFAGRHPIFLGDDITDETVFGIMPDLNGLAYSVGRKAQGVAGHFDSPTDVRAWIGSLLK